MGPRRSLKACRTWWVRCGREGFDALGFDPAPGQLANLEALSTQYQEVARSLEAAYEALTQIGSSSSSWQGEAALAFQNTVGELPGYLDKAHRSLGAAATALQGWHTDLGSMQRTAADLEWQAREALRRVRHAESNPDLGLAGQFCPDAETLRVAQQRLEAATERLRSAQAELEALREQARRLLEQHRQLAHEIAEALKRAREIAPEEPGFFENLGETIGRALDQGLEMVADGLEHLAAASGNIIANLGDVAGDISTMLSVVSAIVEVVPGVGSALGVTLDAVGLGLAATALGGHLAGDALGAEIAPETYALDMPRQRQDCSRCHRPRLRSGTPSRKASPRPSSSEPVHDRPAREPVADRSPGRMCRVPSRHRRGTVRRAGTHPARTAQGVGPAGR